MRVLITGAAGRIGTVLVQALSAEFDLRLTDQVIPAWLTDDMDFVVADITDDDEVAALCRGVDAVVHLAGHPNSTDWSVVGSLNIDSARRVFETAAMAGATRLVYASSIHVCGYHPADARLDERLSVRPDGPYGVSKAAAEQILQYVVDRYAISGVAMRICSFRPEPSLARELSTWISPADTVRLVRASLNASIQGFHAIWGISNNRRAKVDRESWAAIGYAPQDDADAFAGALAAAGVDTSLVSEWPLLGGAFVGRR